LLDSPLSAGLRKIVPDLTVIRLRASDGVVIAARQPMSGARIAAENLVVAEVVGRSLCNRIPVLRSADIELPGDFEDLFASLVEGTEYRPLVGPHVRLQIS
jgi:hypothetical protein